MSHVLDPLRVTAGIEAAIGARVVCPDCYGAPIPCRTCHGMPRIAPRVAAARRATIAFAAISDR